jgi:UDP-N-acetylglucosamine 2-epimerase (non-hydrolysing)
MTAALHCAPTPGAADHLLQGGVPAERVFVTGNTGIDALLWTIRRERGQASPWPAKYAFLADRPMVLITAHRRENHGAGCESICAALRQLSQQFPRTAFVFPLHVNPQVREPVLQRLSDCRNVHLLPPAAYPEFVWLMDRARIVLTDSGGVQEEAPSLGKPVLVLRESTERPEAVQAGAAELVGTATDVIVRQATRLLTDDAEYARRQIRHNPFGDGQASGRIADSMLSHLADGVLRRAA